MSVLRILPYFILIISQSSWANNLLCIGFDRTAYDMIGRRGYYVELLMEVDEVDRGRDGRDLD